MKFKVGDIVKLKSGGPNMTVFEIYENRPATIESDIDQMVVLSPTHRYVCTWFFKNKRESFSFYEETLEMVQ